MRNKIILLITVIAIILLFMMVQLNNRETTQQITTSAAPPVITPVQLESTSSMDSPDGSKTLTLGDSLFVSSNSDGQKVEIYKKEEIGLRKLEIPYNTWSPDNVYVFLKEITPVMNNYFVFQGSGNLFSNGLPYLSVQELFNENLQNYSIDEVTGWAAPNLLIVNTKANESEQKVSFWFDVPSQSFIQLGTYFK